MHGNVFEWCEDDIHESYKNASDNGSAWLSNNKSSKKILRGGSWNKSSDDCLSGFRDDDLRDTRFKDIGFSVACVARRTT